MISETKGYKILKGARGQKTADIDSLADLIIKSSRLMQEIPEIQEIDLNPVIVGNEGEGAIAVDARVLF